MPGFTKAVSLVTHDQGIKPYGPVVSVAITIGIYFASQIAAAILISLPPLLLGWSAEQTASAVQDNVLATFVFVAIIEAVTLFLLHLVLKRKKSGFKSLGIGKVHFKYIWMALAGFAVYFVLYLIGLAIIKALIPSLDLDQKQEIGFETTTTGLPLLLVFASLVILPPVTEEIVARGFLFGGLRTKLPFISAAIITSVLFAAPHLMQANNGLLWVAGIDTFILSLVLCFLREKSGSLWPSIGVHMLKNGLAFVVLFNIINYLQ